MWEKKDYCDKGLHNETNIVMEVRPISFSIAGYYVTIKCNRCGKVFIKEKLTNYTEYIDKANLFNNKLKEALQAKEQECEELRQYHNKCCEEFEKEKKEWLEKYNQVSRDFYSGKYCNAEKCQQLDQLKAENNKYSLFIEKLCDYAGLECDDEEQAMRTLSDLASQINKARWIIDRYKQTLTEIKEIAENSINCSYELSSVINEMYEIKEKISEVE